MLQLNKSVRVESVGQSSAVFQNDEVARECFCNVLRSDGGQKNTFIRTVVYHSDIYKCVQLFRQVKANAVGIVDKLEIGK